MQLDMALPTKKLYAYKSLSSRIFFGWRGRLLALKKTVAQNNPIFARRKTDLKRGFVPKKAYAYKARYGSSFRRLGLVPAAPSFRAATSEHTTPRRNPVALFLPQGEYAIPKINVRQNSTGSFHACTLALYHIFWILSTEIQTFVYILLPVCFPQILTCLPPSKPVKPHNLLNSV